MIRYFFLQSDYIKSPFNFDAVGKSLRVKSKRIILIKQWDTLIHVVFIEVWSADVRYLDQIKVKVAQFFTKHVDQSTASIQIFVYPVPVFALTIYIYYGFISYMLSK